MPRVAKTSEAASPKKSVAKLANLRYSLARD